MRLPKRFDLKTLLTIMAVLAAMLGSLTWRAITIRSEVARITKEGIGVVTYADGWLYLVVEDKAYLKLKKDINGDLYVSEKKKSPDEVAVMFEETAKQMKDLGAKEVQIQLIEEERLGPNLIEVRTTMYTDNLSKAVKVIPLRTN